MKTLSRILASLFIIASAGSEVALAITDNQTDTLSPVLPQAGNVPFHVVISQANFQLPTGLHSGVVGVYQGLWIFIAGRTNGLHGFSGTSFPAASENTSIYVVNPATGVVTSRALSDPSSGLTQDQIDSLSVTSPEGYQENNTLYMAGGYGYDTNATTYSTKPILTAIYLPGIVQWVTQPSNPNYSVIQNISQLTNPVFQIAGGKMHRLGNVTQLVFGQNFPTSYTPISNGIYSEVIHQFQITNNNGKLAIDIYNSNPVTADPDFRRRDMNIVPALLNRNNLLQYGLVAYAGVFTTNGGVWTVPVVIDTAGNPTMADPTSASTFKQAMNQYACATASLYSRSTSSMYHILFGGNSYEYFVSGSPVDDQEIPFINQVTTIKMDTNGNFTQYLMGGEYPVILSTTSNPGNPLLFGSAAYFIPNSVQRYPDNIINLDSITKPTVIGYIVGGIASTLANTNVDADSFASPYVFTVTLIPGEGVV